MRGRAQATLPEIHACNLCNSCRRSNDGQPRLTSKTGNVTVTLAPVDAGTQQQLLSASHTDQLRATLPLLGLGQVENKLYGGNNSKSHLVFDTLSHSSVLFVRTGKVSQRGLLRKFDSDVRLIVLVDTVSGAVTHHAVQRHDGVPVAARIA